MKKVGQSMLNGWHGGIDKVEIAAVVEHKRYSQCYGDNANIKLQCKK